MQIMAVIVDKFVSIQEVFSLLHTRKFSYAFVFLFVYIVCGKLIGKPTVNSP